MKTLREQISEVNREISQKKHEIEVLQVELHTLKQQRMHCIHEWGNLLTGYEHEGVLCKKCGINDMYLNILKKNMESKK